MEEEVYSIGQPPGFFQWLRGFWTQRKDPVPSFWSPGTDKHNRLIIVYTDELGRHYTVKLTPNPNPTTGV